MKIKANSSEVAMIHSFSENDYDPGAQKLPVRHVGCNSAEDLLSLHHSH